MDLNTDDGNAGEPNKSPPSAKKVREDIDVEIQSEIRFQIESLFRARENRR